MSAAGIRLWGSLLVFTGLLVTGPLIFLPFDIMARGPTRIAVDLLGLCLPPYLVWIIAICLCGRASVVWEYLALLVATFAAMSLALILPFLPLRLLFPSGGSFKTDSLQGLLLLSPLWLLLQFAIFAKLVFDTIWRAIMRAADDSLRARS